MDIKVLGTAAAEGWPALFCTCEACRRAKQKGGRNIRRRTAYAINDDTLVDFGQDIFWQTLQFGVDLTTVGHLLVTHSHVDHLNTVDLQWRAPGFSRVPQELAVYGNQAVLNRLDTELEKDLSDYGIRPVLVQSGETFQAGNLTVTALAAQHMGNEEEALNFIIRDNQSELLIANDTGWWEEATWSRLQQHCLNAAFVESTTGLHNPEQYTNHLGCRSTVHVLNRLRAMGAVHDNTDAWAIHFSHNGGALHEHLCEFFAPHGINVAYDGLTISV